ncbi:protein TolR [bacterium]|nr:protein TolR [bacterium]
MAGFLSNSGGDNNAPVAEINITPLVDVMLVLLVIFMVTTPMMESGVAVQLPKASAKALPKAEKPVTLSITKETRVYINKEEVPYSQLVERLRDYFKARQNKEVFIRADGELAYAIVAKTMATVKSAGIDKIGLVTLPVEGEGASAQ